MAGRVVRAATILASGQSQEFDQHRGLHEQGALHVRLREALLGPYDTVAKLSLEP